MFRDTAHRIQQTLLTVSLGVTAKQVRYLVEEDERREAVNSEHSQVDGRRNTRTAIRFNFK